MSKNKCYDKLIMRMSKPQKTVNYAKKYYSLQLQVNYGKNSFIRINKIIFLVGENNKVLDIGCYDGTIGNLLKKNNNQVYGIEISKEAAEIAIKRGLKVKIQNIESRFDFENNFFDVVVAGEIIEHILDTDFFIDEIKRVLKPGGFLVLSTPNVASLGRRILLLLGKNPFFEAAFGYPPEAQAGHIRFFTKSLLLRFLEHKGFKITKFTSNVVNFTSSGKITSKLLVTLFPTLGSSLIIKAKVIK